MESLIVFTLENFKVELVCVVVVVIALVLAVTTP